jgi:hypothetical protein
MPIRSLQRRLPVALIGAVCLTPGLVAAVPAFARKTGLACTACHEVWPRLNEFGQVYRDRGYRLEKERDAPVKQSPFFWPLAMRTTVGYQWLRETLVPTDQGPATAQTGTFGFSGLDVFAAGNLAEQVSFLVTFTPSLGSAGFGREPQDGDLESAFVGIHDIAGSTWANVRVGKHALDLPVDEHRTITLTQGYNVYHFHLQGSAATFEPGENQAGVEWYGHSELSRVRYSISLFNANGAPFSNNVVSSPAVWAHVQGTLWLEGEVLAAVKGGLFGGVSWHPTSTLTLTPPGGEPVPVTGTASRLRTARRYGAELHLVLLSTVHPLTATGVLFLGSEDMDLIQDATRDGSFVGGFGELTYTPGIHWSFTGRYERIRTTDAGSDAAFQDAGNLTAYTGAIRHTFELNSRVEAAVQMEVSYVRTQAPDGTVPETTTALLGLDIAF